MDTRVISIESRLWYWYHVTDGTVFGETTSSPPLALQRIPVESLARSLGPVDEEIRLTSD